VTAAGDAESLKIPIGIPSQTSLIARGFPAHIDCSGAPVRKDSGRIRNAKAMQLVKWLFGINIKIVDDFWPGATSRPYT